MKAPFSPVLLVMAVAMFFATASLFADDAAIIDVLASGPWKISGQGYGGWSSVRIFNKDGTFTTVGKASEHGQWSISGSQIVLDFGKHKDTISLPLNPAGTVGADQHGNPTTLVLQGVTTPVAGVGTPAAVPQPSASGTSAAAPPAQATAANVTAIDELVKRATWTTDGVFTTLQANLPSWKRSSKLRLDIGLLRVKLVEEAAKAPATSPEAYKAATDLCDAWLSALDERDKFSEKLTKAPAGTADMEFSKPVNPNPAQLEQEAIDAKKKRQGDAKKNAFFNDPLEKQWAERVVQLRPAIDRLFIQLGDLLAQPKAAAATPAP